MPTKCIICGREPQETTDGIKCSNLVCPLAARYYPIERWEGMNHQKSINPDENLLRRIGQSLTMDGYKQIRLNGETIRVCKICNRSNGHDEACALRIVEEELYG